MLVEAHKKLSCTALPKQEQDKVNVKVEVGDQTSDEKYLIKFIITLLFLCK